MLIYAAGSALGGRNFYQCLPILNKLSSLWNICWKIAFFLPLAFVPRKHQRIRWFSFLGGLSGLFSFI